MYAHTNSGMNLPFQFDEKIIKQRQLKATSC